MRRKFYVLAAAAGLLVFCGCSKPLTPVPVLLDQAAVKAGEGDWAGADRLAKQVLAQDKDNADALMLRALARFTLDSQNEAVEYAIHAARVRPDSFAAHYIQGMLLSKSGKADLALRALKEALRLRPGDTNTLILLAENSMALRRYQEAAGYFKQLAKKDQNYRKSPYLWNSLGICFLSNPKYSLQFFQAAEKFGPDDPVTALNLAVLHDAHLKQPAVAMTGYERFLKLTEGQAEYDSLRSKVSLRLESLRGR